MQITIIGMHRSGTSLVAGLLGIAGAYLGADDDLMAANASNPKGYWENIGFVRFNEQILEHFGGAWHDPPVLPDGWLDDPKVAEWRVEAGAFVADQFSSHPIWAWKEPRTTLLLPFWRSVVPSALPVICVRNPLDVAASLAKRDGFLFEHSLALWHLHMLDALQDHFSTKPNPVPVEQDHGRPESPKDAGVACVVHYEELLKHPRTALPPILDYAGLDPGIVEQRWLEIQPFIDEGLIHHHHSVDDLLEHPRVLGATKLLYAGLMAWDEQALREAVRDAGSLRAHLREITHFHRAYLGLQTDMNTLAGELEVARLMLDETKNQLKVKTQALEETQATLNTRLHRLAADLSRKANRLPATTGLIRKVWRPPGADG